MPHKTFGAINRRKVRRYLSNWGFYSISTLPELIKECNEFLQNVFPQDKALTSQLSERIEKFIPTIAERKCFGIKKVEKAPTANSNEETQKEALWTWEVSNIQILEIPNLKDIRARREQRKLLGQKLQKIWKLFNSVNEVGVLLVNLNRLKVLKI